MKLFHRTPDDDLLGAVAVPTPCDGVGPTHRPSGIGSCVFTPAEYKQAIEASKHRRLVIIRAKERGGYIVEYQPELASAMPVDANRYEDHH